MYFQSVNKLLLIKFLGNDYSSNHPTIHPSIQTRENHLSCQNRIECRGRYTIRQKNISSTMPAVNTEPKRGNADQAGRRASQTLLWIAFGTESPKRNILVRAHKFVSCCGSLNDCVWREMCLSSPTYPIRHAAIHKKIRRYNTNHLFVYSYFSITYEKRWSDCDWMAHNDDEFFFSFSDDESIWIST